MCECDDCIFSDLLQAENKSDAAARFLFPSMSATEKRSPAACAAGRTVQTRNPGCNRQGRPSGRTAGMSGAQYLPAILSWRDRSTAGSRWVA